MADAGSNHFEVGLTPIKRPLSILTSYHYYKGTDFDAIQSKYFGKYTPHIFADSGAFSAYTQGTPIALDDYITWLHRWKEHFTVYCNLDVVGNPHATEENQKIMESNGLNPLPVFHTGSDFKHLYSLVDRYPYIALGGMVPHMGNTRKIMAWLVQCFKVAEGNAVFHGLGATNWRVLVSLPWGSVDSSSWGSGYRYGRLPVFNPTTKRIDKINVGDMRGAYRAKNLLARYGVTPEQVGDRALNTRQINAYVGARAYMDMQDYLSERFGIKHIYLAETAGSLGGTLGEIPYE